MAVHFFLYTLSASSKRPVSIPLAEYIFDSFVYSKVYAFTDLALAFLFCSAPESLLHKCSQTNMHNVDIFILFSLRLQYVLHLKNRNSSDSLHYLT